MQDAPPTTEAFDSLKNKEQMAKLLGIHPKTLHVWVKKGLVPMIKVSGFCRFDPAKVWAALQESSTKEESK